jgi:regulator of cell morphogenesis and NO signaling
MTLAEVVVQNPAAAEIFDDLNIDYFCRGNRLLGDVLKERNVTLDEFSGAFARIARPKGKQPTESDWRVAPLRKLTEHIVDKHHAYLHTELPALEQLMEEIATDSLSDIVGKLHKTIQRLHRDIELHMRKEEAILFPAIVNLELTVAAGGPPIPSQFGSVSNVTRVLGQDHYKTACALDEIRELTNNFVCPSDVQLTMPALFRRLKTLAVDTHHHVHLENNVLFPRAVALEKGESHDIRHSHTECPQKGGSSRSERR